MTKTLHTLSVAFAIVSASAIANPVILFTKTNGEQVVAEVPESDTCVARFHVAFGGWEGARATNKIGQNDTSSSIPLSRVSAIIHDGNVSWAIRKSGGEIMSAVDLGATLLFPEPDGACPAQRKSNLSVVDGRLKPGEDLVIGGPRERNVKRMDIFPDRATFENEVKRQEASRVAERKAEERESKLRQARESQERAYAAQLRKKLSVGDETHCGMVIERKGSIVKIQTIAGEKWLKMTQIYPPGMRGCRFYNGQYVE